MKTGRNDPCACGSGKKYKHCCLARNVAAAHSPEELAWRRIRHEQQDLPPRMLRFAAEVYGPEFVHEAWWEFMLWDDSEEVFDPDTPHMPAFLPWMLHRWSPNFDETSVSDTALHGLTPTHVYLERKGHQLAPVLREYLQSCLKQPFSFYEIERCQPGHGFTLRDLMTGVVHEVREQAASQSLVRHDVIYAQLASADGLELLEATSPVALPPDDKIEIVELRKRLRQYAEAEPRRDNPRLGPDDLVNWAIELRALYLELSARQLYPEPPVMHTSDGEALEFHELIFDIDSAPITFDALRHLDMTDSDPQALEAAVERDSEGKLQAVRFAWIRPDPGDEAETGTVLGDIRIDGNRLTVQVSSRERADAFRAIVSDKLPNHATFRTDQVQTIEQKMAEADSWEQPRAPLLNDPQAQVLLSDYLQQHYDSWIDSALPALDGLTPRQAVRDADGREQVEALLQHAERSNLQLPEPARKAIFCKVRERLGLTPADEQPTD